MDTQNTSRQLRYLEEVRTPLHRAGFETLPVEGEQFAAKTLEYMTAMEATPQLKASGLDGDYRILADFGGTVLAGTPSKYGVQFVTWDWDYDRTGVSHGHYFMEKYDEAFASMEKRYAGCEPS